MKTRQIFVCAIIAVMLIAIYAQTFTACKDDQLFVDKAAVDLGVPVLTIDSAAKTASWAAVPNADSANGYTIKIGSAETQVTETSYSLSGLAVGAYQISVKTNGYETGTHVYFDSAFSAPQSFIAISMETVLIFGGTFTMGSPNDEADRKSGETQWPVTLSAFCMGKYEVTQAEYEAVMGNNPSKFKTGAYAGETQNRRPVEQVSWFDAAEFCNKLSAIEGLQPVYSINGRVPAAGYPITSAAVTADLTQNGYRLPTEAQWEYACRAGTAAPWHSGTEAALGNFAWIKNNSDETHEAGKRSPNAWGLYDMHGNVCEWCWDWYGAYPGAAQTDPQGSSVDAIRVFRGGSYYQPAQEARSAFRYGANPADRSSALGFRVVRPAH